MDRSGIDFNDGDLFKDKDGLDVERKVTAPVPAKTKVPEGPHQGFSPHGGGLLKGLIDDNFLQYASYVIRDRAIPSLEDGLKPVQRRILFSLKENDDGKFIKVANIVGHCMQYHPHGDASIAAALVNLANKGYFIEGQGNYGNIHTGDPAAASRYIECRLSDLARRHLFNEELTRFIPSYDGRRKEPVHLPAKLPVLLMQGAEGIAVGLSTKILPHNFRELIQAQIAVLQKKPFELFPDFIQGGLMDITEYQKGNGKVRVRAVMEVKNDKTLLVKEIPWGTTTEQLISSVETAAKKKKINIKSINDYTAENVEIEIVLGTNQKAKKTIDALYAFTQCEMSFTGRVVVIENNRPVEMDVDQVLRYNTKRLVELLKKELEVARRKLEDEIHRKSLIQIFVENRIYKRIEEKETWDEVKNVVRDGVNEYRDQLRRDVTWDDVEMLLGIPIKRISRFDINKSRQDIDKLLKELDVVNKNLKSLTAYAVRFLKGLLKTYGDQHPRRTQIKSFNNIEVRELTANELTLKLDREKGYIGYKVQGDDVIVCSSLDKILLVWQDGRYKVIAPPEKLFVDTNLIYYSIIDREKVMTVVYTDHMVTCLKRFAFGGTIMNKDYSCTSADGRVILFDDSEPEEIYLKYHQAKGQRIHQQVFKTNKAAVKNVKAKGVQLTVKKVKLISTKRPRTWDDNAIGSQGAVV